MEISIDIATDMPIVVADSGQLCQVFQNLIGNAIKYRKQDTPLVIRIHALREGNEWQFSVRDNGMGFAPEYNERVFGIFKRLHGPTVPGTGIGLSICKTIIERHGGRIWAEGLQAEGVTVYFTLPDAARVNQRQVSLSHEAGA